MADETRDPREAIARVLHRFECEDGAPEYERPEDWDAWWDDPSRCVNRAFYRRRADAVLAADPIRTLWPEVVEALEELVRRANSRLRKAKGKDSGHVHVCDHRVQHEATVQSLRDTVSDLLARIREVEGGES